MTRTEPEIFFEDIKDPARDGLEGANPPKASPVSLLPVGINKTLRQFVKLEPEQM